MIPYGHQDIKQADIDAVTEVLRSDFLTQGPVVPRFEDAVGRRVGARYAVAVNSATSALHVACLALGLGPGDLLWTVPNTFVASANCGRYCGADIDFVDIDPVTWNMSVERLREKLARAKRIGRLPKVLVPVHFAGQPTEQEAIHELARAHGVKIIEDASHSIGAMRHGERVGSCKWSDITVFSFHPVKIVTTGEGGMSVTNDTQLFARMMMLRSHGITREARRFNAGGAAAYAGNSPPPWYYEQQLLGFNYRLTDIHAVLGLSQLARLDDYVARRNALADAYHRALEGLPLQLPRVLSENHSAYHLYVVRMRGASAERHRNVFESLRRSEIGVNLHYLPVHLQPYYRDLGFSPGLCPEAERYADEALTLPLFPGLSEQNQQQVIDRLVEILAD